MTWHNDCEYHVYFNISVIGRYVFGFAMTYACQLFYSHFGVSGLLGLGIISLFAFFNYEFWLELLLHFYWRFCLRHDDSLLPVSAGFESGFGCRDCAAAHFELRSKIDDAISDVKTKIIMKAVHPDHATQIIDALLLARGYIYCCSLCADINRVFYPPSNQFYFVFDIKFPFACRDSLLLLLLQLNHFPSVCYADRLPGLL